MKVVNDMNVQGLTTCAGPASWIVYAAANSGGGSYKQQRTDRILTVMPHLALATADVYAAAAVTVLPSVSRLQVATPWVCGAAGAIHGIYGITQWASESSTSSKERALQIARGWGHVITAAGYAGLAFGLGPWGLPIIAIGEATRLAAAIIGRDP